MKSFFVALNKSLYRATHWETWHWLLKYMPMVPFWIFYCIRARSCWFFTAANPTLTFGGYEGETKTEMYDQLPTGTYPKTTLIHTCIPTDLMEGIFWSKKFSFPVVVKPNVGRMGLMFRKLNSMAELINYHKHMPVDYLLQEYIDYPMEVSVFYYRYPGHKKGRITGFVRKDPLSVVGDGKHTLLQLMLKYPRVQFRLPEMKLKHLSQLDDVILYGQKYILSEALNLSRGGRLVNLEQEKDERLLTMFDDLSHSGNFYFGRYDIKCASIADLKNRKHFSILEFNGSGAEPHHVYGNGNTLIQAIGILLEHWKILFTISRENHKRGAAYWNFSRGLKHLRQAREHFKILRSLELVGNVTQQKTNETSLEGETVMRQYTLTSERAMR